MARASTARLVRGACAGRHSAILAAALLASCGGGGGGGGSTCSPAPGITSAPVTVATVDQQYRYHFQFTMFCIPFITPCGVELLQGPPGAGIDTIRQAVFWTPSPAQANTVQGFSIATKRDPCGDRGTQSWNVSVLPAPAISSLTAAGTLVPRGATTTLTATFTGTGYIEPIGPVTSGQPVNTPPLNVDTRFTLVVRNAAGVELRRSITVEVPSPPAIHSLSASPARVAQGQSTHLSWSVSGDFTSAILQPAGTDVRGVSVITVSPAASTTYTLVLSDGTETADQSIDVEVVPMPEIRGFTATPASTVFGGTVSLVAEFNGVGRIDPLTDGPPNSTLGPVSSGQPITTPPLRRYSGFRLVVEDVFGRTVTRDVYIEVTGPGTFAQVSAEPLLPTRRRHSATLLQDGRVFIAGGIQERSTEIYDPATNTFAPGPQLTQAARQTHSAVLLRDGRVLLLGGGEVVFPATIKDEIYDPRTGSITPTAWDSISAGTGIGLADGRIFFGGSGGAYTIDALAVTRSSSVSSGVAHAGCLDAVSTLAHGRVLAVLGAPSASALFDPVSDSFSPTGSAQRNRGCGFKATLAGDGRVLVSGGNVFPGVPAELYDPASGTFIDAGMQQLFSTLGTGTTLQDGRVLLVGGGIPYAELYDPSTSSFTETGGMRVVRSEHTATLLKDGRVFVTGGCQSLPCAAEVYSPN